MDTNAFMEGYRAREATDYHARPPNNPYKPGTVFAEEFDRGVLEAWHGRQERRREWSLCQRTRACLMLLRLSLAPWFRAAFSTLVALRDIGYTIRDIDVDRLIEDAIVAEHPELR